MHAPPAPLRLTPHPLASPVGPPGPPPPIPFPASRCRCEPARAQLAPGVQLLLSPSPPPAPRRGSGPQVRREVPAGPRTRPRLPTGAGGASRRTGCAPGGRGLLRSPRLHSGCALPLAVTTVDTAGPGPGSWCPRTGTAAATAARSPRRPERAGLRGEKAPPGAPWATGPPRPGHLVGPCAAALCVTSDLSSQVTARVSPPAPRLLSGAPSAAQPGSCPWLPTALQTKSLLASCSPHASWQPASPSFPVLLPRLPIPVLQLCPSAPRWPSPATAPLPSHSGVTARRAAAATL